MKKQKSRRKLGKKNTFSRRRRSMLETLEDRRLLTGELNGVVIGVGTLPRRDTLVDAEIIVTEIEGNDDLSDTPVNNSTLETAQPLSLGFGLGEFQAIDVRGELSGPTLASLTPPLFSKEVPDPADPNPRPPAILQDDSSIPHANVASSSGVTRFTGIIGDSPLGNNGPDPTLRFGDGDYYELANIQAGQFVTAHVADNGARFQSLGTGLILYNEFGQVIQSSESSPGIPNFISHEVEADGDYYFAVVPYADVAQFEIPDNPFDPAGVRGGSGDNYVITLSVDDAADIDFYAVDLEQGDILGVNGIGSVNTLSLRNSAGDLLLQSTDDRSEFYPLASPLPGGGNSSLAYVIDEPGTYYIGAQAHQVYDNYVLETRVFRPAIESEPEGAHQILFLDFDGAEFNPEVTSGPVSKTFLSPMSQYVPRWGLTNEAELIDKIVAEVKQDFEDLRAYNPSMKLSILNSKDHADPFGQPNVSRVIVGGSQAQLQIGTVGIAESIDVGNFDTSESAVLLLDLLAGPRIDSISLNHYTIAPGASKVDLVARGVSAIISHEAAHFFGAFHTENLNADKSIIDSGGDLAGTIGIGPDLVWGSSDDTDPSFINDVFSLREGYVGIANVPGAFASVFVEGKGANGGTETPTASGLVYGDVNGDGQQDDGEIGFAGIRVYADANGDGEFGISEPTAITDVNGHFDLDVPGAAADVAIRIAPSSGQVVTAPADGGITIGQILSGVPLEFGVQSLSGDASGTDFGHAPASYGSASHDIQGGVRLGSSITGDDASGEDANDDGVSLTELVIGGTGIATITAVADGFAPGIVNGWIDFNDNGRFESSERVVTNQQVNGTETMSLTIPAGAVAGETWARFRMGYVRNIGPNGASTVGEVEDYVVTLSTSGGGTPGGGGGGGTTTGPQANPDVVQVDAGAADVVLNVLANDSAGSEAVTIQQVSSSTVGSTIAVSSDGQRIIYTPAVGLTDSETFSYTIGNAIDTSTSTVTVNIAGTVEPAGDIVRVRLEATTPAGAPLTSVVVGQNFNVSVYLDDLRNGEDRQGVFASFLDVEFDTDLAEVDGLVTFGDYFVDGQNPPAGDINSFPDGDDDYGGFGRDAPPQATNQLLVTIPLVATTAGVLDFSTNGADNLPFNKMLFYPSQSTEITDDRVDFGTTSVTITDAVVENASPFTNPRNRFDVDNDGHVVPRDALFLITNINENGSRKLNPLVGAVSGPYLDVTGDGYLSPRDALDLIAEINRIAAAPSASEPSDDVMIAAIDAALSVGGQDDDDDFFVS